MMAPKSSTPQRFERHPFLLSVEEVAQQLSTNIETGLSSRRVTELQRECPPNELVGGGATAWYKILIKQMTNAMILVKFTLKNKAKRIL